MGNGCNLSGLAAWLCARWHVCADLRRRFKRSGFRPRALLPLEIRWQKMGRRKRRILWAGLVILIHFTLAPASRQPSADCLDRFDLARLRDPGSDGGPRIDGRFLGRRRKLQFFWTG